MPQSSEHVEERVVAGFSTNDTRVLFIGSAERRCQRWNVDRIANRLVARRINHVAQCLLCILYAATLGIAISQEYQLLQLTGPQATNAFSIYLQYAVHPLLAHLINHRFLFQHVSYVIFYKISVNVLFIHSIICTIFFHTELTSQLKRKCFSASTTKQRTGGLHWVCKQKISIY